MDSVICDPVKDKENVKRKEILEKNLGISAKRLAKLCNYPELLQVEDKCEKQK